MERLEQEIESRGKAEAAAAEAERQRSVLAVDLKDMHQKFERLQQEYNAVLDTVNTRMHRKTDTHNRAANKTYHRIVFD